MSISNLGTISTITSQITTGAPQAGFRCNSRAAATSGSGVPKSSIPLRHLDI